MKKIGVRDAKIHLSRLIEEVLEGKQIIITNHNRPVARLCPVEEESLSLEERINRLERQGILVPEEIEGRKPLPPPLPVPDGAAQKYLQDDRDS